MPITIQYLHKEIKQTKQEISLLKQEGKALKDSTAHDILTLRSQILFQQSQIDTLLPKSSAKLEQQVYENPTKDNETYINLLTQITFQKWHVNLKIVINKDYTIHTVALIYSSADLNCINEGLVPTKYFEKTKERLQGANGSRLTVQYKLTKAHVCNQGLCIKTPFILVKDLNTPVILGTPFISLLYPFKVDSQGISTSLVGQEICFLFAHPIDTNDLNTIKDSCVTQVPAVNRIESKTKHLNFLKQELIFKQIEERLSQKSLQDSIQRFRLRLESQVCSDLQNAFWHRRQHIVELPYQKSFNKKDIPTKARPSQMSQELLNYCMKEVQELLNKSLIQKSRSPWSCAVFYVQKNAEIERGVLRLVINYKPLNEVLQWIRYPLPNKKHLIQRLVHATVFSKFDLKSGFWQIQIAEKDRYKTAFTVPFGHYEWNMLIGNISMFFLKPSSIMD
ncbi:uncharacterized protein LOC132270583 [Cornus florida]|uniref:uncharacterized protein LOC132270580 n=1 Tax=Cornus florida TaxID=4283 RepID=UPI0028A160A4|nr:uncharacterized protein LOC132270580 [Cornus florida]XP_059627745.1 uncharacterized protein LOC132270583 [Cornus florida]